MIQPGEISFMIGGIGFIVPVDPRVCDDADLLVRGIGAAIMGIDQRVARIESILTELHPPFVDGDVRAIGASEDLARMLSELRGFVDTRAQAQAAAQAQAQAAAAASQLAADAQGRPVRPG